MNKEPSQISTSKFFSILLKASSLEEFVKNNEKELKLPSFKEYITELCNDQKNVAERIIKRANIERSFGHQIFRGSRNPSRDTVLQLAFGFEADVDTAQELLKHARMSALYPRVKRDAVIIYCLHYHFTLMDTQLILYEMDLPLLGGGRIK